MKKPSKETQRLAALLKKETPQKLNLVFYRFDSSRIRDIVACAARMGVTLTSAQAVRYAIRHCPLGEATAADFSELMNEPDSPAAPDKKD